MSYILNNTQQKQINIHQYDYTERLEFMALRYTENK